MYYYKLNDKFIFSKEKYAFTEIPEETFKETDDKIFYLFNSNPNNSRRSYCISDTSLLDCIEESIELFTTIKAKENYPLWLKEKIKARKVMAVNTAYKNYSDVFSQTLPEKWRINIVGLGDVGATLATGLKLLGTNKISEIGLFELNPEKSARLEFELNQINSANNSFENPTAKIITEEELFNCDIFLFCVSIGVPAIGDEKKDVRLIQFEGNSKIVSHYARLARKASFKGIFGVVSDPVDLLCKAALASSNTDDAGNYDFLGLAPEQIKGFGLGVMNARALYYSKQQISTIHYAKEGRAFGPHGEGLIIADSIDNYNPELSLYLTEKTKRANLDVRATGFKPYIAPALSSGAITIIDLISGNWHYSSNFLGGVFMGSRNKLTPCATQIEQLPLKPELLQKLSETYNMLKGML